MKNIDANVIGRGDGQLSEYGFIKEMKITISRDYDPVAFMSGEKDITEGWNNHVLTVIKDDRGVFFYSCKRKDEHQLGLLKEYSSRTIAHLVPGKEYIVNIFKPVSRHRNPEEAGALSLLMNQSSILPGAQGLSAIWPLLKDELSMYDVLMTFDEKGVMWVCGVGKENATDIGGIPHVLKPSVPGIEDYFGIFAEVWDGGYHLLCVC